MSKQRVINTKLWSDNFVVDLEKWGKFLFVYFLSNEKTELCGIYELPLKTIAFETGIDMQELPAIIMTLEPKIYYIKGWVYIRNFAKHQKPNPSILKGIERSKELIPKEILEEVDKIEQRLAGSTQSVPSLSQTVDTVTPEPPQTATDCDIPELKPILKPNGIASQSDAKPDSSQEKEPKKPPKRGKKGESPPIEYTEETLEVALSKMEEKEGSYLDIIATYIREKPVTITNSKQLSNTIGRFAQAAQDIEGAYSMEQVLGAIDEIKKDNQWRTRKGEQPIDWGVETIFKKLTKS